jgi:hypothetical protein
MFVDIAELQQLYRIIVFFVTGYSVYYWWRGVITKLSMQGSRQHENSSCSRVDWWICHCRCGGVAQTPYVVVAVLCRDLD